MAETDLITLSRATVQQVLDALEDLAESAEPDCDEENCRDCKSWRPAWAAIAALKAALKQPQQCMAHGECFGGQCIYTSQSGQPEQDTDCPALEQPEQEPVAWRYKGMMGMPWSLSDDGYHVSCKRDKRYIIEPLYTHPPRQWQSLTDTDIGMLYVKWDATPGVSLADFARDVEAALKEKNT
jgi:hypothetical protein